MSESRRRFMQWLGLTPFAGAACKVEPILDLPPPPDPVELGFIDLPPRIPEQLEGAEEALSAALEGFFSREIPYLDGGLRQRSAEDPRTTEHLVTLLQSLGLEPAGPRGGWLQPVELRLIELPAEATAMVRVRGEQPEAPDSASATLELLEHGAFRQRRAGRVDALLLTAIHQIGEPLPRELVAGRVVLLRATKELDMSSDAVFDQLDGLTALARQSGAAGCLVLTSCTDAELVRLRERWRREFHLAATSEADALVIEGVLTAGGSDLVDAALKSAQSWVLDADLGLREQTVLSHNVVGRLAGRELPGEATLLACAWDTTAGGDDSNQTLRLLASMATIAQLAEWQRRGAQPRRSIVAIFAVDAGLGAGHIDHARWSTGAGVLPTSLLAFDHVEADVAPAEILLAGHFDARVSELAERSVRRDGRTLRVGKELTVPSLAPYLRTQIPVMTIGAAPGSPAAKTGTRVGLHAAVRLARDVLLALADQIGPQLD